ncbi:MBOAT family O-acyltransferase [candidate division CSSED10-310 bacterium]|uniref:MBOAT family O-acyltransferase n=1 Tax=candidate division CSSED10-310 bacterium TaxID=2855610 RepID=A0ABV6Z093_UNCC1
MIFFDELYVLAIIATSVFFWTVVNETYRTRFIILTSFIALAFIQLKFSIFLVGLVWVVYRGSLLLVKQPKGKTLTLFILIPVIVLLLFKYAGVVFAFLFSNENHFSQSYLVPLGVSYLSFKMIAYIVDVFRGTIKDPKFDELLAFILFIPMFPAGPIERYQDFAGSRRPSFDPIFFVAGLKRLVIGYFKKVVLVNFFLFELLNQTLLPQLKETGVSPDLPSGLVLLYLVGSLFYAYLDLSAYADIAIGYGQLFGYKICENMNYPIVQKNLSDFWDCWHISLSHWCRNNIYFPVLGKTRIVYLGLYCCFIVMGLWHYISLNWVLWGMWHATGLYFFSHWSRFKRKHRKWTKCVNPWVARVLGAILTVLYASMGYAFITMSKTDEALRLLLALII